MGRASAHRRLPFVVDESPQLHRGRPHCRWHRLVQVSTAVCFTSLDCSLTYTLSRFDGSMSQQKREELIKSFSAVPKYKKKLKKGEKGPPTVMLISLKVRATVIS